MADWPRSGADFEADVAVGQRVVAALGPFVGFMEESDLAKTTRRRHLNWLWSIGGEIIREIHDEPTRRRWTGERYLRSRCSRMKHR